MAVRLGVAPASFEPGKSLGHHQPPAPRFDPRVRRFRIVRLASQLAGRRARRRPGGHSTLLLEDYVADSSRSGRPSVAHSV